MELIKWKDDKMEMSNDDNVRHRRLKSKTKTIECDR